MENMKKLETLRERCLGFLSKTGGHRGFSNNLNWERHVREVKYALGFVPRSGKILDVGCGVGHTTCISKIFREDVKIYGFDIGGKFIWKNLTSFGVNFLICNAEDSCFKDETFDVIISFGVIEHTNNRNVFLREIRRILKPGGYFFVFDLPTKYSLSEAFLARMIQVLKSDKIFFHDKRYTKKETEVLFSMNGFSVDVKEDFLIPSQVDRISGFLGRVFNKNCKKIDKLDKLILKTPLKIFSQAFMVRARKL